MSQFDRHALWGPYDNNVTFQYKSSNMIQLRMHFWIDSQYESTSDHRLV